MATQCDSFDIAKLKDFALGLTDLKDSQSGRDLDVSQTKLQSKTPVKRLHAQDNESSRIEPSNLQNSRNDRPIRNLRLQGIKSSPPISDTLIGLSASQHQLPSTVPDSQHARMAISASQSQGDTQPLSPGVTSRYGEQQQMLERTSGDGSQGHHSNGTEHIDLLAGFEQPTIDETNDNLIQDEDIDPISQLVEVRAELYPESKRFQQPKTPATASKKRTSDGQTVYRGAPTPKLPVNPFAGQAAGLEGMMNSSQAFKATQFTSPVLHDIVSDGLSQRPSPAMDNAPRPSTAEPTSSPARPSRTNKLRAVTEPQTRYISMKESQDERERLLQLSAARAAAERGESDEDFDSEPSQIRRLRKRRRLESKSKALFDAISAPARPGSSGRGRGRRGRTAYLQRLSPHRQSGSVPADAVLISDDAPVESNVTEDETEHEEEPSQSDTDSVDELAEENKENISMKAIQVPMTALKRNPGSAARDGPQLTPSRIATRSSPSPDRAGRGDIQKCVVQDAVSLVASQNVPTATQTVAIVDSQTSRTALWSPPDRSPPNTAIARSSPDARMMVPQSQFPQSSTAQRSVSRHLGSRSETISSGVPASSDKQPLTAKRDAPSEDRASSAPPRSTGIETVPQKSLDKEDSAAKDAIQISSADQCPQQGREKAIGSALTGFSPAPVYEKATVAASAHPENSVSEQVTQIGVASAVPETVSAVVQPEVPAASAMSSEQPQSANLSIRRDTRLQADLVDGAQSNPSTMFETAATHMAASPHKSPSTRPPKLQSIRPSPSPKKARVRSLTEIAAEPSPPDPIGEVDMDFSLLTKDDEEFQAVINGSSPVLPTRKRRRGRNPRVVHVPVPPSDEPASSHASGRLNNPAERENSNQKDSRASAAPVEEAPSGTNNVPAKEARTPSKDSPLIPNASQPASRRRGRPRKSVSIPIEAVCQPDGHPDTAKTAKTAFAEAASQVRSEETAITSPDETFIVSPNRVFAHFNGNCAAYYPATCIGVIGGEEPQYRVRFDDGTVDTINSYGIKRLELRPGDNVKVDMSGARKHNYVVERMQDRQQALPTPDPETPSRRGPSTTVANNLTASQTDIRGHATVVVTLKQASDKAPTHQSLSVPLRDIYLTQTMWTNFKDRLFIFTPTNPKTASRLQTPSERPSNPSTPSSRSRRIKTSGTSHPRSMPATTTGIFTNTSIALTNISNPTQRTALKSLILTHGGHLLADGFSDLFRIPPLTPSTPSKRSPSKPSTSTTPPFSFTPTAQTLGFTCLIADRHCRMLKYIQALALGIPCLSPRWIHDSIALQSLQPWEPYLLAAGESSYLHNAIRSRILSPLNTTTLPTIVEHRPQLLRGDSVLLIMPCGEEEKMASHPLIMYALGARKVGRAGSVEGARAALGEAEAAAEGEQGGWDWVYSHDREEMVEKSLFGKGGAGRKRKRGEEGGMAGGGAGGGGGGGGGGWGGGWGGVGGEKARKKPRVIGNEFIVQSLILGRLVE